jgi:hypothetical protein
MVSTIITAMLIGGALQAAATAFNPPAILSKQMPTQPINNTRVEACWSDLSSDCNYGNALKCGTSLCTNTCLSVFPELSRCCDASTQGTTLTEDQAMDCWNSYAVFETMADGSVSVFPSSARPAIEGHTLVGASAPTADASNGTSNTTATAAPAITSAALTTSTNGAQSQTSGAAAAAVTTTTAGNGADALVAAHGQQLGFCGVVFTGMMSLFLL